MKKALQRPTHEEYVAFVEEEFAFLQNEYGYKRRWDSTDSYRAVYSGPGISVHIWGWGYGASGHVSLMLGEEQLPYHEYVTPFDKKLAESTGKQQLNDLREHAHRLRNECAQLLRGDLSVLDPYRPFPNANELWHKRDYSKIVELLNNSRKPLSRKWQARYEHALKNA
jgi:hypothetical protein